MRLGSRWIDHDSGGSPAVGRIKEQCGKQQAEQIPTARVASSETYLDLLLRDILGLSIVSISSSCDSVRVIRLTRLLTITLLSPEGAAPFAPLSFAAPPREGFDVFWTPPTGAVAAGRPAARRWDRRRPPRWRVLERISSSVLSSLPDILLINSSIKCIDDGCVIRCREKKNRSVLANGSGCVEQQAGRRGIGEEVFDF